METLRLSESGDVNVVIKQEPIDDEFNKTIDDDEYKITQCIKDVPLGAEYEAEAENGLNTLKMSDTLNTVVTDTYRQETITSINNDEHTIIKTEKSELGEEDISEEDLQTNQYAIKLETEDDYWDNNEMEFKVEDEEEGEDTIITKEEYDELDGYDAVAQQQQGKLSDHQINTDCDNNSMMLNDCNEPDKVKPKEKKQYKCQDCDKSYAHKSGLICHSLKQNHNPYQCDVCDDFFRSFTDYKHHMMKHKRKDDKKYFKCQYCDKQFLLKHNHKAHEGLHTGTSYECEICKKCFTSISAFRKHQSIHTGEKCNIAIDDGNVSVKNADGGATCNANLDKNKDDKNESLIKEKTESGLGDESSLHCCGNKFSSTKTLKVHKDLHHPKPQIKCNICEKTFAQPYLLTRHERKHKEEKPFKCQFCDNYFKSPEGRYKHESKRCQIGKPFKCALCGKGYAFLPLLKAHEQHKHMKDKQ